MRSRLKRAGILNRKVLQRLKGFLDAPTSFDIHEVFPALNAVSKLFIGALDTSIEKQGRSIK